MTPGDAIVSHPTMTFDRSLRLEAAPDAVWPWLVQLGKGRAGWYLPRRLEAVLPRGRRAARTVDARWQELAVGDRVPDYGGRDEYLEVALLDTTRALVYRSERRGAQFTWALLLAPEAGGSHLRSRFRGALRSRGWRQRAIVAGGDRFDRWTIELMFAGLAERLDGR